MKSTQQQDFIVPVCKKDIDILFEDEHLLIIHKPEPLLSTPGRLPQNKDSAISRIQEKYPSAQLVHRLDMATSGLMLIPLTKSVNSALGKQFIARSIEKSYVAVLHGLLRNDHGSIDLPIISDWEKRPLQKVCYDTGKPSLTHYHVSERCLQKNTTRVVFTPITGRSHQLRIHSQAIGHPILGCQLYHNELSHQLSSRLLLHASDITFTHPITQQRINWQHSPEF